MAQTQRRMLYAKIWTSEQFSKLSDRAKLLYIGTITLSDDDGRLIANPAYLRGQIFTYDDLSLNEVLNLRNEVEKIGLIEVYKIDDFQYIQHPNWSEYQVIRGDLYTPSKLPDRNGKVTRTYRKSSLSKDKISKDKISKDKIEKGSKISFEDFWKLYPNKCEKKKSMDKWEKLPEETKKLILEDIPKRITGEKWSKNNGQFIEMPTTYLNGERWNDEIKKVEISNSQPTIDLR